MRDGKPKPQNTEFRFSKEVRGKAKINDNPIVADLDMLQKKHSNVLKTKGAVARLILAIKDDPTHFLDGSNPQNALLLKKLKDSKTGMIGVRREDTPENLIVHALKSSNKKEIERLVRRQMGRASLPTTLKNETGTGAKAHSSASGDIISQNSAKDELKTLSKEYDVEQFLKDREGILAKDARYGKTRFSEARIEDNGGVDGWEYKRTPAGYDKNYKADFLITKADVVKIRGGKIDEQGSKIEQAEAKQEVVKGDGWTMRDGKLTYLDQVKFELDDWLKAQTGIDDVITASLAWLKSEHPEMHNSKRVVKELIEYVLDRPSVVKSGKSENSVYLGKADDNKMKDIVIDKGDKKIIHANRRRMNAKERDQWQGRPPSLHTDTKPAGANGASARSLTSGDIISQNAAKDETAIKTYVNPHVGAGLAGGTLNAKDENGNFDAEKFAKGFIYGLFGSKVTAATLKKTNPKLYDQIVNIGKDKAGKEKISSFVNKLKQDELGKLLQKTITNKDLSTKTKVEIIEAAKGRYAQAIKNEQTKKAIEASAQKGRDMTPIGRENLNAEIVEYVWNSKKTIAVDKLDAKRAKELNFKHPQDVRRTIGADAITHAINRHGKDSDLVKKSGQKPVTFEDIAKWEEYADNASISAVSKDKSGQEVVVSGRQINGYYVIVEEIKKKRNELAFKTMFFEKGDIKNYKGFALGTD